MYRFGFVFPGAFLVLTIASTDVRSQAFDPDLAWPLCGRITEDPPAGWVESDGCPSNRWGNPDHSDLTLNSVFGPRPLASESNRYDFHRGLDIGTPEWTPVFAIADGEVKIAGDHSSYSDPLVQLRHTRPGTSSCEPLGCYHSNYMHLKQAAVAVDDVVSKGDLIGYTGKSASGFAHLHFEVRDAPPDDPFSRWQRDTIPPLEALPYQSADSATVTIDAIDTSDPDNPIVRVAVQSPRVDVGRVELLVYDAAYDLVAQPGNLADPLGYNVHPAWFDFKEWNRQYTHKDSSSVPWESFGQGGVKECPFYADHGPSYDANVHMDRADPADDHVGLFNGVRIETQKYNPGDYTLSLTFNELQGPAQCILAEVSFAAGGLASGQWGDCSGLLPVAHGQSVATDQDVPLDIVLTGSSPSGGGLTYQIVSPPTDGDLSGTAPQVTYTPDPGYTGPDGFEFLVNDGTTDSNVATVSIDVEGTNGPPVADDQSLSTPKNTALDITLSASDPDGDPLSFQVTGGGPAHGLLVGADALWTYTPDTDYTGHDDFTFVANDGQADSNTATVSLNVKKGKGGGGSGGGSDGGGGGPDCDAKPNHPKCQ
jgi:murein DD-endopeptidase MepM/ murein hydrolase activator NlpD